MNCCNFEVSVWKRERAGRGAGEGSVTGRTFLSDLKEKRRKKKGKTLKGDE